MTEQKPARRQFIIRQLLGGTALLALLAMASPRLEVHAADPGAAYRSYGLRYAQADEVARVLQPLLPDGPGTKLVVDSPGNQLLLSGPEEAQAIARQLIASLDKAPSGPATAAAIPGGSAPAQPVLQTYSVPAGDVSPLLQSLRQRYATLQDVRITGDQRSGQLIVVAPPAVQQQVASALEMRSQNAQVQTAGQMTAAEAIRPADQATATRPIEAAGALPRFVQLNNTRIDQVEPLLRQMLGERLEAADTVVAGLPGYWLETASGRVGLGMNRPYGQLAVVGPDPAATQVVQLVKTLDSPRQPQGQTVRIFPLGKADLGKVRRAVDAYRGKLPRGDGPDSSRIPGKLHSGDPNADQAQHDTHDGAVLPAHQLLAQEAMQARQAAYQPPGQALPLEEGGVDVEEDILRDLSTSVEVEALPDLDVIILRGNQREVEEVLRIIDEIERLSAQEQPVVEVYQLQNVGGEGVADLIAQVNDALLSSRQGQALVLPLVKPNALLLVGRGEAIDVMLDLIQKLDQPVNPDQQMRVFRLQHATATATQTLVQQFFTGRQVGLVTPVTVTADVRSNSVAVHASPADLEEVALLIERIDVPGSGAVNTMRLFRLQNTLATDLAQVLRAAITGQGTTQAAGANNRNAVLEFLTVDPQGQQLLKSGSLNEVLITPDPRTNTLLVSSPPESIDLIAALIQRMDDLPASVAQIKVFRVVNGEAASLVRMLESLLGSEATLPPGPQLARAGGEPSLAPLRFSVDTRTNSIIASGSEGDLLIVEAILLRLDDTESQNRRSTVVRLKNSPAIDVAISINEFLRSERQVQLAAPGVLSPFRQIEQEVVVVPEPVSNSLIISATNRFYDEIMRVVEELDRRPPQVLIQVLIAEVGLNDFDEFGIELGLQDSVLFDRSVVRTPENTQGGVLEPGYNFNNQPLGNSATMQSLATAGTVAAQGLSSFSLNRVNGELGYGGLVLSAGSESVSVLLRALSQTRRLDVLSRPQVMTLDNQPAFVQVGQRVPRITDVQYNTFGQSNVVELENVGLILGVTPRISPDGLVVMEVDAERSELGPESSGVPVGIGADGTVIRQPVINTITAQTTVSAASGQTVVLGGLITKYDQQIYRRVPLLSDVPVLGMLFRYDSVEQRRSELLIVLTPHVVRSEEEAERLRAQESARMSWCLADVRRVHMSSDACAMGDCPHCESGGEVIYPDGMPAELDGVPIEAVPAPGEVPGSYQPVPEMGPQFMPDQSAVPQQAPAVMPAGGAGYPQPLPQQMNYPVQQAMHPQAMPQQVPQGAMTAPAHMPQPAAGHQQAVYSQPVYQQPGQNVVR